jgi:Protein of unknown function (DUF4235)
MGKKSGGSGGRLLVTAASAGAVFVVRKVLAAAWTRVTGKVPPTDLTDPKVTLAEALGWAVLVGVTAETARFAVARAAARRTLPEGGDGKTS